MINLCFCAIITNRWWYEKFNYRRYNDTIIKGIKGFFRIYDPDYNARDMKITADYPLYNNLIGKLEGIEFIEKYLESLYYENEFCKAIPNVEEILQSYSKDYKNLIINIFSVTLMTTLEKMLPKKEVKKKEEVYANILTVYKKLKIQNTRLNQYIEKGISEIKAEIYNMHTSY